MTLPLSRIDYATVGVTSRRTTKIFLGPNLAACARDLYHRYHDCKDADSYLAGETLYDVVLLPAEGSIIFAILACGDCAVKILN